MWWLNGTLYYDMIWACDDNENDCNKKVYGFRMAEKDTKGDQLKMNRYGGRVVERECASEGLNVLRGSGGTKN